MRTNSPPGKGRMAEEIMKLEEQLARMEGENQQNVKRVEMSRLLCGSGQRFKNCHDKDNEYL